jgi:hypothetical protein
MFGVRENARHLNMGLTTPQGNRGARRGRERVRWLVSFLREPKACAIPTTHSTFLPPFAGRHYGDGA